MSRWALSPRGHFSREGSIAKGASDRRLGVRRVSLLDGRDLRVELSGTQIIKGATMTVERGELVALVGRNGAGKTTLLSAISGLVRLSSGSLKLRGVEVGSQCPEDRRSKGIVHVPEGRRVFPNLTVRENLLVGGRGRSSRSLDEVLDKLPALADVLGISAGSLASSDQQLCCLGRALMSDPAILMLDEICVGLSPLAADEMLAQFPDLVSDGIGMLLIDQNVGRCMSIADRAIVLDGGMIIADGSPGELLASGVVSARSARS